MATCLACTACSGLCGLFSICCSCAGCGSACCKGEQTENTPLVGRVRALSLMLTSILIAILGQYWLYEYLDGLDAWEDGCDSNSEEYTDVCIGNTAVYRVSFTDAVFFLLMAMCAACSPVFNNGFWGLKTGFWVVLLVITIFLPNEVFDTGGYTWAARIGAFIFLIMQQLVLIDLAYRWNDGWVAKAQELGEETSEGKPYLVSLVVISGLLYAASLSAIGVMFHYFSGCAANETVISLTLILCLAVTALQLMGGEGNLLASAVVTAYATFLCFSAVSKTPRSSCNPFVGETNVTDIVIGIVLTVLSLFWVTLNAARTVTALLGGSANQVQEAEGPVSNTAGNSLESGDKSKPFVQTSVPVGVEGDAADASHGTAPAPAPTAESSAVPSASDGGLGWRFNIVMVLISMYFAMMLTNWGDINEDGESSDPKQGWVAMWLTTAGQWMCLLIYAWTLVAPRVFPDRDFS